MSKAEEAALKAYPLRDAEHVYDEERVIEARECFIEGYHQAEKDLSLTWEDMLVIHRCIKDAMNYHLYKMMEGAEGQKVVYEEVLNRFYKLKEK